MAHFNHMDNKFAGCDENQSGQRFLDSSAPRLIRHVESCETAAGGEIPQPAGKDQKLSREFEGRALISAEGAVPSSLDLIENNRHSQRENRVSGVSAFAYDRPMGRGKFCGRLSIVGVDPKTGLKKWRRLNCNSWTCSYCGPRKARTARAAIRRTAEGLGLRYFLTLTLDPSKLDNPDFFVPHLRLVFNKFRFYLKRMLKVSPSYICVLEFTQAGLPHLHILFDRFLPQKWISNVWDSLGGGRICFIKQVTVANVSRYLSKYLTKELLLSAPKGTRRITTSRSIKLFPKMVSDIAWAVLKRSIYGALQDESMTGWTAQVDMFTTQTLKLEFDEENYLKAFEKLPPLLAPLPA
jgi:hypothetical protein